MIHRDDIIKEGFLVKQLRPESLCLCFLLPAQGPPLLCFCKVQAHEGMEKAKQKGPRAAV